MDACNLWTQKTPRNKRIIIDLEITTTMWRLGGSTTWDILWNINSDAPKCRQGREGIKGKGTSWHFHVFSNNPFGDLEDLMDQMDRMLCAWPAL